MYEAATSPSDGLRDRKCRPPTSRRGWGSLMIANDARNQWLIYGESPVVGD